MLNIILNIVGITLVLYSIFTIKKDISIKKDRIDDLNYNNLFEKEMNNDEYSQIKEESFDDFEALIDNKIKLSHIEKDHIKDEIKTYETYKNTVAIIKDNRVGSTDDKINPLHKKVMELKSIGLSNEEIAKKMGKGIREIEIILKICKKYL